MVGEEVTKESISYVYRSSRVSLEDAIKVMRWIDETKKEIKSKVKARKDVKPVGKQTVKQLIGQDQGVTSVDVAKTDLREFQKIAGRFGVDFAVVKNKGQEPPIYTIFFKARDQDAISKVVQLYTEKKMLEPKKPSIIQHLKELKSKAAEIPHKVAHREKVRTR